MRAASTNVSAVAFACLVWFPWTACGGGTVVAWGGHNVGQLNPCATDVVAIATGYEHSLLLKADGTVADCGMHYDLYSSPWEFPIIVPSGLANVIAVSGGYSHSLALKADGTVVAWGRNTLGQTNVPPEVMNVVAISACDTHSLALRTDGTVVGWGSGSSNVPIGLTNVVAIAAGSANLALRADGTVVGWNSGVSAYPSLTNGIPGLTDVIAISAGWNEWLALKADGTVIRGSFGNVTSMLNNIVAISASSGTDHHISLAAKADGTVVGWGFNFYGGPMVPPGLAGVVAVSADSSHCLALVGGGAPFLSNRLLNRTAVMSGKTYFRIEATGAWPLSYQWLLNGTNLPGATAAVLALTNVQPNQAGNYSVRVSNGYGAVTSASGVLTLRPLEITQQPQSQTSFVSGTVALGVTVQGIEPLHYRWRVDGVDLAGATNSILVLTNLQFSDTGVYSVIISNAYGTLASSNITLTVVPSLIITQPSNQVTFVGGGPEFRVAAQGIEPISFQWKFNGADLAGATNTSLSITSVRQDQAGSYSVALSNAVGVARSSDAILSVVRVAGWGDISQASVPKDLTNVIAIAAGIRHALALRSDNTVIPWGPSSVPADLTNVVAVAGGSYADGSLALKDDGTVTMWGNNSYSYSSLLSVAASLSNIVAMAGGQSHMLALRANGTVVAWGSNASGQTSLPSDLTNAVAIAAGQDHCLALKADGTVRAWGYNRHGETNAPTSLSNAVAIAAGAEHSLALRADGTVVVWGGESFYGQTNVPPGLSNVVAISGGEFHSLALKTDGTVAAWGDNWNGQTNVPVALTNVTAIAAGGRHSLALVGDGPMVLQESVVNPKWDGNRFRLVVPTQSGRVYRLEYKNSLTDSNWIALPLVAGNGAMRTMTDETASGTQRFYRVRRW